MMDIKGRLSDVSRDMSGKVRLTFTVEGNPNIEELEGRDLRLKTALWKDKRSLDANAYLWVLCTALAEYDGTVSRQNVYELMLRQYGTLQTDSNGNYIVITVPSRTDVNSIAGHWLHYKQSYDGKHDSYLMIKGSSDYNKTEMSKLLNGVVSEAVSLGIPVETPEEIARMEALWEANR